MNKTQRKINKYFFSHYFVSYFSAKISSEGKRQPTIYQTDAESYIDEERKSQGNRNVSMIIINQRNPELYSQLNVGCSFKLILKVGVEESLAITREDDFMSQVANGVIHI
jgi:hypothetical protein